MSPIFAIGVKIEDTPLGNAPNVPSIGTVYPNLAVLVQVILKNAFSVIGLLLLILLIYGGLMYIIGAGDGDSKKAAQAQATITDALIGFAVVFSAYFIIQIIQVITGISILNSTL
jgi:hypothetical protein